ncbi:hypothetical protein lerEdw1_006131 [Lerista edwardsae]|nr:hypothetical protein lerEdw1_006131 [Lerista edwardsae]
MDVGAAEFEEKLPTLQELILGCDFVGLDMEFTGLHSMFPSGRAPSLFDSPAEWYQKARASVQQFTVSQLGLSIFSSEKSNKYMAHSYNFFLFPMTLSGMDSEFSFRASTVQFLSHYGFDYNRFLKGGIPYMNETQEQKLQQHLLSSHWTLHSGFIKDNMRKVIDEVTLWVVSAKEDDSIVLHDVYGFQMFEIQLILRQSLQDIWTIPLGHQELMVKKINPRRRWLLEKTFYDSCRREQILLSARGFTNLFQTLVKAKKLLVGHNMLLDLLHLHDKFYKPLPENYEEFKKNIHFLFPVLLDTKNIAKSIWKEYQFPYAPTLLEVYEMLCRDTARTCSSFSQYFDVLAVYVNQVNLIRAGAQKINFSGADDPAKLPPLLIVNVRGWPGVNEEQIHRELRLFCKFDVQRLRANQFLLLANKFKGVRLVLKEHKAHPNFQISLYHHWRHSPQVNCFLQICGIVASWSLVTFLLGGSVKHVV